MKFVIDIDSKEITIEQDCNLGELVSQLKAMFPQGEWRTYNVRPKVIEVERYNTVYVDRYVETPQLFPTYPQYPFYTLISKSETPVVSPTIMGLDSFVKPVETGILFITPEENKNVSDIMNGMRNVLEQDILNIFDNIKNNDESQYLL